MLDYKKEIQEFIQEHYVPGIPKDLGVIRFNSSTLLELLFTVFPDGCIDSYDLYEILKVLDYKVFNVGENEFCYCLVPNTTKISI